MNKLLVISISNGDNFEMNKLNIRKVKNKVKGIKTKVKDNF